MRKLNLLRWCVPCSQEAGKLIERVCPAAEREREDSRKRSAAKTATKRRRATVKRQEVKAKTSVVVLGVNVPREVERQIAASPTLRRTLGRVRSRVSWRKGDGARGRGARWCGITIYGHRFVGRHADDVRVVIAHELVHCLVGRTRNPGHTRLRWHGIAFHKALAQVAQELWRVDVGWAADSRYDVDNRIHAALRERRERRRLAAAERAS